MKNAESSFAFLCRVNGAPVPKPAPEQEPDPRIVSLVDAIYSAKPDKVGAMFIVATVEARKQGTW